MTPARDRFTIVIAGAFNPAILVPPWIAKNVLTAPLGENFQVQVHTPITGIAPLPRFTFGGLSFSPSFQNLTFFLEDSDAAGCERVCDAAARILELLPHTPIAGLGWNFGFTDDHPSVQLLQLLQTSSRVTDALGAGATTVGQSWANRCNWEAALVTALAEMKGDAVTLDMNFHYAVESAAAAQAILAQQGVYARHQSAAERIAAALTQEAAA
jgi:hypothetical protein